MITLTEFLTVFPLLLSKYLSVSSLPDTKNLTCVRTFAEIRTMIQADHGASLNSLRLGTRNVGYPNVQTVRDDLIYNIYNMCYL